MLILTSTHKAEVKRLNAEIAKTGVLLTIAKRQRDAAQSALRAVTALETPSCASIGKRMAATARQALPGGEV